jgi:hypothetical protein
LVASAFDAAGAEHPPDAFHVSLDAIELAVAEFGDDANIGIGIDPNARRNRRHAGMRADRERAGDRRGIFVDHERQRLQRALVIPAKLTRMPIGTTAASSARRGASRTTRPEPSRIGTILEDIALDAVPGFFRRLVLAGGAA